MDRTVIMDWIKFFGLGAPRKYVPEKLEIENVLFHGPATVVFFNDGTKSVVKCQPYEVFDREKGIATACAKRLLGNKFGWYDAIDHYVQHANHDTPWSILAPVHCAFDLALPSDEIYLDSVMQ